MSRLMRAFAAALAVSVSFPFAAAAQDPLERTSAVTVDLVQPGWAIYVSSLKPDTVRDLWVPVVLDFKTLIADHFSLSVVPSLVFEQGFNPGYGGYATLKTQLILEVDWHPFDSGLSGLFVGVQAFGRAQTIVLAGAGDDYARQALGGGLGVAAGYEVVLPFGLLFSATVAWGGGVEMYRSAEGPALDVQASGIQFFGGFTRTEIGIGYAF